MFLSYKPQSVGRSDRRNNILKMTAESVYCTSKKQTSKEGMKW